MKISIITVCYNSGLTINDTLFSIITQNYKNYELIIIDGGSTDSTLDIIKNYEENYSILISERDRGVYDAMNKGLKHATGDVVGFLNSDDFYINSNVLNEIAEAFNGEFPIDCVYGDLVYVDERDTSKIRRYWKSKPYYDNFFNDGLVPPHPTFYIRTDIFKSMGGFSLDYKFAADYDFMFRALKVNNLSSSYIPKVLVRMRLGGKTSKSLTNILKGNLEILSIWMENQKFIPLPFLIKKIKIKIWERLFTPEI